MSWEHGNLVKKEFRPSSVTTLLVKTVSRVNQRYRFEKIRRQRVRLGPHLLLDLGFDRNGNPLDKSWHDQLS